MAKVKSETGNRLLNRAYKYVYTLTAFFLLAAVIAALVGKYLDEKLAIAPWGTVVSLLSSYLLSLLIGKFVLSKFKQL